ncbi:hypothetical protein VKT23_011809 [Stygiomarasmius scandens]|uniref:DUF4470 domain-containing protein n=1 Tax=Marasmiellus scandens TaxID=2682957 RepID=A0ABR1JC35_9AGAR
MSIVDDWGDKPEEKNPMRLSSLSAVQRSRLAFMFGGVGDARHVFSSMIGIHKAYKKLMKQETNSWMFIQQYLHATSVSRCYWMTFPPRTNRLWRKTKFELPFSILSHSDPSGLLRQGTMQKLLDILSPDHTRLPSWIHVVSSAAAGIMSVLNYWKTKDPEKTAAKAKEHHNMGHMADSGWESSGTVELALERMFFKETIAFVLPATLRNEEF